jgi:hypothetical protein
MLRSVPSSTTRHRPGTCVSRTTWLPTGAFRAVNMPASALIGPPIPAGSRSTLKTSVSTPGPVVVTPTVTIPVSGTASGTWLAHAPQQRSDDTRHQSHAGRTQSSITRDHRPSERVARSFELRVTGRGTKELVNYSPRGFRLQAEVARPSDLPAEAGSHRIDFCTSSKVPRYPGHDASRPPRRGALTNWRTAWPGVPARPRQPAKQSTIELRDVPWSSAAASPTKCFGSAIRRCGPVSPHSVALLPPSSV